MNILFTPEGWDDYTYWQKNDKKILEKINKLIKEIKRNPTSGIGKSEPLKYELSGLYSQRINKEHRLIYKIENNNLIIFACRYHYK